MAARGEDQRMAEAARRHQQLGGDLVRRLIARPVRLEQQARMRVEARADARPGAPSFEADDADETDRLQAEVQVMKAVLRAQRRELESLRAQREVLTASTADDDARTTRERWAALVDSLLIRAR
jgi:hypothetical protein